MKPYPLSNRYVYERVNGNIHAREYGKTERTGAGQYNEFFKESNKRDSRLWNDILIESEQNPALQHTLEKAIMLYRLSKDTLK